MNYEAGQRVRIVNDKEYISGITPEGKFIPSGLEGKEGVVEETIPPKSVLAPGEKPNRFKVRLDNDGRLMNFRPKDIEPITEDPSPTP